MNRPKAATGPKTIDGKRRASKNSLKHGALSLGVALSIAYADGVYKALKRLSPADIGQNFAGDDEVLFK